MGDHYPTYLRSGAVLQSGLPTGGSIQLGPSGLLMRGVVTATYVVDDPNHPYGGGDTTPCAVYCDVLTYSSLVGARFQFFPKALVSQELGGMQRGRIWKPRATTVDISGSQPLDFDVGSNPSDMDGDHVLLAFMDHNFNNPVILRGIPHPSVDTGHTSSDPPGARLNLVVADGDPDFMKHHGAFYGVSDTGDIVLDASRANTGLLQDDGSEPDLPQDGSVGNLLVNIEQNAKRLLQLLDMSDPTSPTPVLTELLNLVGYVLDFMDQTPGWQIKAGGDNVLQLQNKAGDTTAQIGDGAKHVTIAEALQDFWSNTVQPYLDTHTHPTSTGPAGPPPQASPAWNGAINSSKVSIPDG